MKTSPCFPKLTVLSFSIAAAACVAPPSLADGTDDDAFDRSTPTNPADRVSPDGGPALLDAGHGARLSEDSSAPPDARPPQGDDLLASGADPHPAFSFSPSNLALGALDLDRAPSAVLDCGDVRIDSTSMVLSNWCGAQHPTLLTQKQKEGPDIVVVPLAGLTIEQGTALRLTGSRPVVFVVKGHVAIRGALDASAADASPGPGGNLDCGKSAGGDASAQDAHTQQGGTGGGFGTAGGSGGCQAGAAQGAARGGTGVPRGTPELVPLIGGCAGGYAGGCVGREGGGGGALQISASGAIVIRGAVRVDGGAGARACSSTGGGTGGGSGGGLLLEAQALSVPDGALSAAGGEGGPGANGATPGTGASQPTQPGAPGSADTSGAGGGGGGGYGRIQLRSATSSPGAR